MATRIPVLTFHAIDQRPDAIAFRPDRFRRAVGRLRDRGYRTISLLEIADSLRAGTTFPDRSLAITFDDGYRSVYERAFPILREMGMTGTVFLTVGKAQTRAPDARLPPLGGRTMLRWSEVRDMRASGFEFGAHTLTHPDLTRLTLEEARAEIRESKERIEEALGEAVSSFAYPFGRFDTVSIAIVRELFSCGCSDRLGLIAPRHDPSVLPRLDAYYMRSDWAFRLLGTPWFAAYVAARDIPRRLRRWSATRGARRRNAEADCL